jgi:hypothetical protein
MPNYLPDPVGGFSGSVLMNASTTVFQSCILRFLEIPECFKEGNGDLLTNSPTSAFWLFNQLQISAIQI